MAQMTPLPPEQLYHACDTDQFSFETTAELDDLTEIIGQPRAVEAVKFGIGIERKGYNIFALGPAGIGKHSLVRQFLEQRAQSEEPPPDICYVHNFDQPHRPHALRLLAGTGAQFAADMEQLVENVQASLSSTFESEEYRTRRQAIEEEVKSEQEQAFEELQAKAQEQGFALLRTPAGLIFAPIRDGEIIQQDEFQTLAEEERKRLEGEIAELQEELQTVLQQVPRWERELRQRIKELNREVVSIAIGPLFEKLRDQYSDLENVIAYLDEVEADVQKNVERFLDTQAGRTPSAEQETKPSEPRSLRRYTVNVLVDHSDSDGAPVVYEDNPTHQNLIGRVEHRAQMGALLTDFTLIKPGALHKASGGYLMLDARRVLQQPASWETLKRTLRANEIRIESLAQQYSAVSTVSLEPEPVPLNVKVALVGDRMLYYMLAELDPEFDELFKVEADFEEEMERTPENQALYAQLIATLARKEDLRPLDRSGVARVIEHGSRLVEDTERLSVEVEAITDLLREADYWAGENGTEAIGAGEIQRAIDAQIYRKDRLRERMQEQILRETILIDTDGERVGQINGLSVYQLGNFAFGKPTRITARVHLGKGEVVDIEREVELGGPIHSKGVLILSSFLSARYAEERPLSLAANLVFEQSYGGIDGDSASSAELYALLSAIADVPIKQSLAVTGSVNQHGRVQAIGGVNEKIEGFFDICKERGLTGEQGVLIPDSNVKHLMLRDDVVDAVREGTFRVYPIETVDQGIELLTGVPAGERDEEGNYPEDSINGMVERRLAELAEIRASFDDPGSSSDSESDQSQGTDEA